MSENDLFPVEDIDKMMREGQGALGFTLSDVLLILLYADRDNPLVGKIRQMKEIFLTLVELRALKAEHIEFEFKRYGPYSKEVVETIDNLLFINHISSTGTKNQNNFGIQITKKGAARISSVFDKLPEETKRLLSNKRNEWDTLTTDGIMKYIYTHYPAYLANSVLKKRHAPIDWNEGNDS